MGLVDVLGRKLFLYAGSLGIGVLALTMGLLQQQFSTSDEPSLASASGFLVGLGLYLFVYSFSYISGPFCSYQANFLLHS